MPSCPAAERCFCATVARMTDSLLLDIGPLSCAHTDALLEGLYKSAASDPPSIWTPHHDPLVAPLMEQVTRWGSDRLQAILADLSLLLGLPGVPVLAKAELEPWRMTPAQRQRAERYLAGRSHDIDNWTLDDWLQVVELIINEYLPPGVVRSQADYIATLSNAAGRITAVLGSGQSKRAKAGEALATRLEPSRAARWANRSYIHQTILQTARARAATLIQGISGNVRSAINMLLIDREKRRHLGDPSATPKRLQGELLDRFGPLNRDWRRIAITECGNSVLEGMIAGLEPGTTVRRMEVYATACPFCRKIDGRVLTVVAPDAEPKDWDTQVWVGKTNLGRSASPRKRVGNELIERTPAELWTIPAGLVHPHCRGTWQVVDSPKPPGVDSDFARWLEGEINKL